MKRTMIFLLTLAICVVSALACAETGVAYGVYRMEGESPDSLIRATVEVEDGKLTSVVFDEKLLPVSVGGAEGWAQLPQDEDVPGSVEANGKRFAPAFRLDGGVWTIGEDLTVRNEEKGEFLAWITGDEGGAWYFAQEQAELLDGEGSAVKTVPVGTKASIEHGVHFWVSPITFPGNIEAIQDFLVENGADFAPEDIAQNADGYWQVADAVSGATLAGTPNYLLLAQEACRKAAK